MMTPDSLLSIQMEPEKLIEAAGTGEVLTVIYHGGRAPGHKRRIAILKADGDVLHVHEIPSTVPKTYMASKTQIVADDDPAPWMPEDSGKAVAVDPVQYFTDWAYTIRPCHWSALGVNQRYVIDKIKTDPARAQAIASGMDKQEATQRIKIMRSEHAVATPPAYAFGECDVFYRGEHGGQDWVQVIGSKRFGEIELIEAHWPNAGRRKAYRLPPHELAACLESGQPPPESKRIAPLESLLTSFQTMID